MNTPLDLVLLKSFVAVVETGGFSHAAERIGRSQSAISMQMQRLEESVGKPLLIRTPRAATPSPAGEVLLNYARRLLRLSDEAWTSVARPQEVGSVSLGVPDDYAAALLPLVLARFAASHPLVTVDLVCEPSSLLCKAIAEGRLDLAIVTRRPEQALEVLRRERMVWVASPQHVVWQQDPLPVAVFEPECTARAHVLSALSDADRPFRATYSSPSLLGLIAVVQAGLAVAGIAECAVPSALRIVGLAEDLPPLPDLEVGVLRNKAANSPAARELHKFLRLDLPSAMR